MAFLILGALVLLALVAAGRSGQPVRIRREWRYLTAAGAIVAFLGAAFLAVREAWIPAVVLLGLGVSLMSSARLPPRAPKPPPPSREPMSAGEARSILGVGPGATKEEILAAYSRRMRLAQPDKGGTSGLAAQLNAARDRLVGK